jgi:hypothetical protein
MEPVRHFLAPLTDALPASVRQFLDAGGWWLVLGLAGLLTLLLVAAVLGPLWRALGRRRRPSADDGDLDLEEDLDRCPVPAHPPGPRRLTVYHLPVRLCLVVVAPAGTEAVVDATAVSELLDRVVPGLGAIVAYDLPRVRVWPAQLSAQGFTIAFHRRVRRPEAEGQPSRWVLVAGRAQVGRHAVLVGLGLWADEPNNLGRLTLQPHQWLDVLRLKTVEGGAA